MRINAFNIVNNFYMNMKVDGLVKSPELTGLDIITI